MPQRVRGDIFFLISKKSFIKTRKAPLSTLGVYKGTAKANQRKQSSPKKLNPKTRKEHRRSRPQNKPN
jgi:hypothetical protein